jgi:hypothetical protein
MADHSDADLREFLVQRYMRGLRKRMFERMTRHRLVNVKGKAFLDSHGKDVTLWGDGVDIGGTPDNITWILEPVQGSEDLVHIINVAHNKYLDSHGDLVWLWAPPGGAHSGTMGGDPQNVQWRLVPVSPSLPNTFYIVSRAHKKFLDGNTRYMDGDRVKVHLWGDGLNVGGQPEFLQWELKEVA